MSTSVFAFFLPNGSRHGSPPVSSEVRDGSESSPSLHPTYVNPAPAYNLRAPVLFLSTCSAMHLGAGSILPAIASHRCNNACPMPRRLYVAGTTIPVR